MERREIEVLAVRKLHHYLYNVLCGAEIAYIFTNYNLPVTNGHLKGKFIHYYSSTGDYARLMADQDYLVNIFVERSQQCYNDNLERISSQEDCRYYDLFNKTPNY